MKQQNSLGYSPLLKNFCLILSMFIPHPHFHILAGNSNSRIKYLSQDETERFFSFIDNPRDKALFSIIYLYGLRVSEATLLRVEDIDLERKRVFIRRVKGGLQGERPLFRIAERLVKTYLRKRVPTGDGLFTGRQGNLSRKRIQQLFKYYAKKAGLDSKFSVHCLRHSIATHLLEAGEGIEFVRDHLGHKKIENTLIYAQLTDKRRDEVFKRIETKIARV